MVLHFKKFPVSHDPALTPTGRPTPATQGRKVSSEGDDQRHRALVDLLSPEQWAYSFRPLVDLQLCDLAGFMVSVRAPSMALRGSFSNLSRIAQRHGLWGEFAMEMISNAARRFALADVAGTLFVPMPVGALTASFQHHGPSSLGAVVQAAGLTTERMVLLVQGLHADNLDAAAHCITQLRSIGLRTAIEDVDGELTERHLQDTVGVDYAFFTEDRWEYLENAGTRMNVKNERADRRTSLASRSCSLVADGIASRGDLRAVKKLGMHFGAGPFIGRLSAAPARALPAAASKALQVSRSGQEPAPPRPVHLLERLLHRVDPVLESTPTHAVYERFESHPELHAIAVINGEKPVGLISRFEMIELMAPIYRKEIYGHRPCQRFMNNQPMVFDVQSTLEEVGAAIGSGESRHLAGGFIVVDGARYLGLVWAQDLMREITLMQLEAARHANPLTGLPGNVAINAQLNTWLARDENFCFAYVDLDKFKSFNDVYGYAKGDDVIRLTAVVLEEACDAEIDFVGHVGGDDFVLLLRSVDWQQRLQGALDRFGCEILNFFSPDDIERGGYMTENRKGELEFHGLVAVSIGVVEISAGKFQNHLEVARVASEVKKKAKTIKGNSMYVDQRKHVRPS